MKKILCIVVLAFVLLFCTACEGDVTRALRHEGFSVGGEFECEAFFGENATEKARYLTSGGKLITTEGRIYEVSFQQKYSNGSHCKVADSTLKVVSIFDDKIFKADDGKLYTLNAENNTNAYTEVSTSDNSYAIYELLLSPSDVIKAVTADSNNGIYYVLKSDGNVYAVTITKATGGGAPSIASTIVVYNSADFGGNIIDFGYNGNSSSTFVRTETKVYRMKATNADECSKFADVPCDYQIMESPFFEEYKDYVFVYNGSTVITTYQKIFSVSG